MALHLTMFALMDARLSVFLLRHSHCRRTLEISQPTLVECAVLNPALRQDTQGYSWNLSTNSTMKVSSLIAC